MNRQPEIKIKKKKTKIIWRGFIIRLVVLFFLVLLGAGVYFGYKAYYLEKKIVQETPQNQENKSTFFQSAKTIVTQEKFPLRGDQRQRINILLLGMGGEGHSGRYLTDTIILVSINPKTYQAAMLSLPRDLYIQIPETKISTKINAAYAYGMNETNDPVRSAETLKKLVTQITGQTVDYYIAMNFDGFEKIIEEIDGVDVQVTDDIYDDRYPGPNFSYTTFQINKGFHHLDGETALKYARVRHVEGGDFGRSARQQQILAATKKKALSLGTILNPAKISSLMDVLGDNLKTDIRFNEIPSFLDLAQNVNIYQTTNKVLDAWNPDSLLVSSHAPLGGVMAYILVPRAKNYSQIKELSTNIFDLALIERKKKSVEQEDASLAIIIRQEDNPLKIKTLFSKLGYPKVEALKNSQSADCQKKTLLIKNSDKPSVFTLDDLNQKLEAEVVEKRLDGIDADIVVCLAEDAAQYLEIQNEKAEDEDANLKEQSVIDEKGKIRVNQNNN